MVYRAIVKPIFDFIIAFVGFLLLSPIFIFVFILLVAHVKGNPFFLQLRPGKGEKLFKIIKFKTMSNEKDAHGNLLPDADRLSGMGRFVRSASLDEIPQLLNVLLGDMSIVGPRPLLPEYLTRYDSVQKKRHDVIPGITGWAQVNGRNAISWEEKLRLDVYYVQNGTFILDCKILIKTLAKVIKREDINNKDAATMEAFKGTEKS